MHMPGLAWLLPAHERWRVATRALVGTDADGNWNTAQAKEYPFGMSCLLANAMLHAAISAPIAYPEDPATDPHCYQLFSPQLANGQAQDFGQDYVDNPLPVHHVNAEWMCATHVSSLASRVFV